MESLKTHCCLDATTPLLDRGSSRRLDARDAGMLASLAVGPVCSRFRVSGRLLCQSFCHERIV